MIGDEIYFVATRPYISKAVYNEIFYTQEEAMTAKDKLNEEYKDIFLFKVYRAIVSVDKEEVKYS